MKKYKFKINGQTYEVEIGAFEGSNCTVHVNGTPHKVEVQGEEKRIQSKTPVLARKPIENKPGEGQIKKTASSGGFKVISPLPGTVFKLKCSVGDTVNAGDTVLIMEAMKMENNIITEKGGTIAAIKVKEGDAVLQGDVLVEIA